MLKRKNAFIRIIIISSSIFLSGFFYLNNTVAASSQPEIEVRVDNNTVTIGDIIRYRVTLKIPPETEVLAATEQNKIGDFYIRDFKQNETHEKNDSRILKLNYKLAAYEAGLLKIPAYGIQYRAKGEKEWNTLKSGQIEITVKSVLDKTIKEPELKPLKAKMIIWQNYLLWIFTAVIILALILLLLFLRRRKQEKVIISPRRPAHVIAYEELEYLKTLNLPEKGRFKEYFEKLSGCLRRYLENRFNLRAPLMSTEEFLETARTSSSLKKEQKILLKDFLELADLVKFARYGSSCKEAEDSYTAAKNFVDQTKETEAGQEEKAKT